MKKIITIVIVALITLTANSQVKNLPNDANFYDFLVGYKNMYPTDSLQATHIKRMERLWAKRLSPNGDVGMAARAINQYAQNYTDTPTNYTPNWTELGPIGDTNSNHCMNGQIHNIVFDPQYNGTSNKTLYASSAYSGLWRSENDGQSWSVVNTDKLPVTSTSDLAIDPNNSNIIYIATGDSANGNADYGSRAGNINPVFSTGVYRSTDYGGNWEQINTGLNEILDEGMTIRNIEINPNNDNQLFIATSKGVYRTNTATNTNPIWTLVLDGLNDNYDSGFKGLEFKPNNSNTIYASGQDIYKSVDGGDTWVSMTNYSGTNTNLDLLNLVDPINPPHPDVDQTLIVDRINITVTPAAVDRVYAYIVGTEAFYDPSNNNALEFRNTLFIYMFKNNIWEKLYTLEGEAGTQDAVTHTRNTIAVSPVNPEAVYFGYTKTMANFDIITNPANFAVISEYRLGDNDPVHADIHSLEFQPNVASPKLFMGSDGGLSVKEDPTVDDNNWQAINNGLGANLIWTFDDTDNNENYILIGLQDNGTKKSNPGFNANWDYVIGFGDGYGAQINDFNDNNAFYRYNHTLKKYDYQTGQRVSEFNSCSDSHYGTWENPIEINDNRPYDRDGAIFKSNLTIDFEIKNDPKTGDMYWTFAEIFKRLSQNVDGPEDWSRESNIRSFEPAQWRRQINRFEIADSDSNYRYIIRSGVFSFDGNHDSPLKSFIYKVEDGSVNYTQIMRPGEDVELFPIVSDIVVDPENPRRIWITYTSYNETYKVWFSDDAGAEDSWVNIDPNNTLPNLPVNAITYQKGTNDILYIATDAGVFVKDGESEWEKYGSEIPNCMIQDLKINYCNNKLRVATYGRGMWEGDILPYNKVLSEIVFNAGENVIWEADVKRGLRNSVRIKSGATLTIKSELSMPEKAKITVEKGGKLILDGAKLSQNCGLIWQGITIQGNPNIAQTEANQGVLEMINGATIEYAEIGVLAANASFNRTDDNSGTGAIIRIDNAIFRDNIVGIEIPKYKFVNHSYIKNSVFTTTDFLANANRVFRNFISLSEVGAIEISDNQFKNLVPIPTDISPELFRSQGRGIVAFNSKTEIYDNSFENLYQAIEIKGTFSGACLTRNCVNTDIYTNTFTNNWNAIQLNSTKNTTIISNDINVFPYLQNGGAFSSSGLYITNSKAFHIEGNNIFAHITAFTNGIFIRDCNSVNEIYKNDFNKLYTAIYAYGNNRKPKAKEGLQILCNAFIDNSNDIYIAPNSIFSTEVGHVEESAGNTFSPVCNTADESARQFNNLSNNHITYLSTASPEYLPNCNYNLNLVNILTQNECPDLITRIGSFADLLAFDSDIADKKSILLALTDGGDTEALTETVEEAEENQALRLRNNLLRKSPTLSDTVMVSSTFREEVLPPIMLKQVLAANPKAAKSTKVQNALDDRANLLPEYMREEINLGKNNMSFIETVESNLSNAMHQREITVDLIIRRLTREDTETASNQLKDLLISESQNNLQRKYQLVNYYLSNNESQNAQNVFNSIPQDFELSTLEEEDYNQRMLIFNMKLDLLSNDKSWFNINQEQYTTVNTLAIDSTSTAGMQARAILSLIDDKEYGLPIPALETGTRKSTNATVNYDIFEVTPNIATNYFIMNYALDTKETVKEVTFEVYNNKGKKMLTKTLKTRENQFLTECNNWQEGIYWCKKVNNGRTIQEKRFIIERDKTPNIENLIETFSVYPNPTDNQFFVDFNIFNIKNTNIQITDVKGAIIKTVTIAKNTNKVNINTKSWQSGIYFVSLLSNNELVKTVKVVIK